MTTPAQKLRFFLGGTSRGQPARPATVNVDEQRLGDEIADEVARQFEQARSERRLRLDLRPILRRKKKEISEALAAAIAGARPKKVQDGRPTGGSLARARGVGRAIGVKAAELFVKAGNTYGVKVRIEGLRRVQDELREVAARRVRAEKDAPTLVRELEDIVRRAKELERLARERKKAAK